MAEALSGAIGEQAQTYNATVVSVPPKAGYFLAFSNRFGNIKVLSRTNDNLAPGDRVFIRRAGPEKQAPYLYQGFGGGVGRTAPGIAPGTPIYVDPPNDGGTGTAPVGTIQYYLNELTEEIRRIKGTADWRDKVDQNLVSLLHWRSPVDLISKLPTASNRVGDIRFVREANALYVFGGSTWLPLTGGTSGGTTGDVTLIPNGVTNMAVGCSYILSPAPHQDYPDRALMKSPGTGYIASGGLLTDSAVGGVADTEYCVGWYGQASVQISLDVTRSRQGNFLRVWGMACDDQRVYRPSAARFEYSDDQQTWSIAQDRINLVHNGTVAYERWMLEADIKSYGPRRYWRVTLNGTAGWLLVSEFEFMAGIDDEVDTVKVADSVRTALTIAPTAPIATNKLVALTATGLVTADCVNQAHAGNVCGISTEAKGAGQSLIIQTSGVYIFPSGTFTTTGSAFLGANGAIVTTIPTNAKFVQPIAQ